MTAVGVFAPVGELTVVDGGQRVVCHLCGAAFAFLPGHLLPTHGWRVGQYREAFGLSRSTSLCAPVLQDRRRQLGVQRYRDNAQLREGLQVGQAMARSGQLLEIAHAAQPAGSARLQRRRQITASTAPTRRRTSQRAAERLQARLQELGFAGDLDSYLRQRYLTQGWPVLRIARELGIGNSKIKDALDAAGVVRRRPGGADSARGLRFRPPAQ